jgi:hypothetical protein
MFRSSSHYVGDANVYKFTQSSNARSAMVKSYCTQATLVVCSLAIVVCEGLIDKSRMSGDVHVLFCESLRWKFLRASRLQIIVQMIRECYLL